MIKKVYPYMLVNKLLKQGQFTKAMAKGIIQYVGIEEQNVSMILDKYNQCLGWDNLLQYPILRFLHQRLMCNHKEKVDDYLQYQEFLLNLNTEKHEGMVYALQNMSVHSEIIREFYDDEECISEVDIYSLKYSYSHKTQFFYLWELIDQYNQNPQPELIRYIELIVKENVVKYNYFKILEGLVSECQPDYFLKKIIILKDIDDLLTPYIVMAKLVLASE